MRWSAGSLSTGNGGVGGGFESTSWPPCGSCRQENVCFATRMTTFHARLISADVLRIASLMLGLLLYATILCNRSSQLRSVVLQRWWPVLGALSSAAAWAIYGWLVGVGRHAKLRALRFVAFGLAVLGACMMQLFMASLGGETASLTGLSVAILVSISASFMGAWHRHSSQVALVTGAVLLCVLMFVRHILHAPTLSVVASVSIWTLLLSAFIQYLSQRAQNGDLRGMSAWDVLAFVPQDPPTQI